MRSRASPAQTGSGGTRRGPRRPGSLPGPGVGGELLLPAAPPVEVRVAERAGGVLRRPARAAGDVQHRAALGVLAAPARSPRRSTGPPGPRGWPGTGCRSAPPAAPSASAAATPRPSAIPPAARTGTGATRSTTTGTNGSVERPCGPPCPPALRALRHDHVGAQVHGLPGLLEIGDLEDQRRPASRMRSANGLGSPNDSITARGPYSSARSTTPRLDRPRSGTRRPRGARRPATIGSSRASQSRSPPGAQSPRPPPRRPPRREHRRRIRPSAPARSGAGPRTVA